MGIDLKWSVRSIGDNQKVYRSTETFTKDTLPAVLETLGASVDEYSDNTADDGTLYFYAVETVFGSRSRLSAVVAVVGGATAPIVVLDRLGTGISDRAGLEAMTGNDFFYLENDIDLSGADWVPLAGFHGTFDMGGFTISNMSVTAASSSSGTAGFFGTMNYAHVMLGRFLDCSCVSGSSAAYNGIIAGVGTDCLITDILLEGSSLNTGGDRCGSVIGYAINTAFRRTADLSSTISGGGSRVGSYVGYVDCYNKSYNWYNNSTLGLFKFGTGKSTATLKAAATWTDWNSNIYDIVDGFYPTFKTLDYTIINDRIGLDAMVVGGGTNYGLYRLGADIDCSGSDFDHNHTDFRGDLDGNGYNITDCNRPSHGGIPEGILFRTVGLLGTMRNLAFEGTFGAVSSSGTYYQGFFGGGGSAFTYSNVVTRGTMYEGGNRGGNFGGYVFGHYFYKCIAGANIGNGTFVGAFIANDPGGGTDINNCWGGRNAINAQGYTANYSNFEEYPRYPVSCKQWDLATSHVAINYTNLYFSEDLWLLDNASLPTFKPK